VCWGVRLLALGYIEVAKHRLSSLLALVCRCVPFEAGCNVNDWRGSTPSILLVTSDCFAVCAVARFLRGLSAL